MELHTEHHTGGEEVIDARWRHGFGHTVRFSRHNGARARADRPSAQNISQQVWMMVGDVGSLYPWVGLLPPRRWRSGKPKQKRIGVI